jgi:ABC-type transporter Mla MlaB component
MSFPPAAGLTITAMAVLVCDLTGVQATASTVDALARLAVALKRQGARLQLRHVSTELVELIAFMGLADVLRVEAIR